MNCAVCGSPLSRTRCAKNSKLICPNGHSQPAYDDELRQHAFNNSPNWAWAEWVEQPGIGE